MKALKHQLFLSTGSNQGDSLSTLAQCNKLLADQLGTLKRTSPIYQTKAWGKTDQPDFLNQVIWLETIFTPQWIFIKIKEIEKQLGRIRREKWGPRIIDIDILFYDQLILSSPSLEIPHPQIAHRNFVLKPLLDIAPHWIHPQMKLPITELWEHRSDPLEIHLYA